MLRIANSLAFGNSYSCVAPDEADSYYLAMRGEELKELRRRNLDRLRADMTLESIAEKTGTDARYLSQILGKVVQKGGKRPRALSDDYATKIERGLGLPSGWMDQPHGDPSGPPPRRKSRGLADLVQPDLRAPPASRGLADLANTAPGPDTRGYVPLISWVRAGEWDEAVDVALPDDDTTWLPCPASHGLRSYALRVQGDSMTAAHGRSYPDGCIIFVDPDQRGGATSGARVVAKLCGTNQVTFKVYVEDAGRRFLKPLNPQHPPIYDEFVILGRVIGTWIPE